MISPWLGTPPSTSIWLVVWNMTGLFFHDIWDVILPIDELIFFKMVIAPPTSPLMSMKNPVRLDSHRSTAFRMGTFRFRLHCLWGAVRKSREQVAPQTASKHRVSVDVSQVCSYADSTTVPTSDFHTKSSWRTSDDLKRPKSVFESWKTSHQRIERRGCLSSTFCKFHHGGDWQGAEMPDMGVEMGIFAKWSFFGWKWC